MSDYFTAKAEYEARRAEIDRDAYIELIELVTKHGNRRLKDQMWALAERARQKADTAHAEFRSTVRGGA